MVTIDKDALEQMRDRGGLWACYENQAFDSANAGHCQFLKIGPGCTYGSPPGQYPKDTEHGLGWRYRYVGFVDLATGEMMPQLDEKTKP